jgi:hypothetical protein
MRRKTKRNLLIASYVILFLIIGWLAFDHYRIQSGLNAWSGAYYSLKSLTGIGNLGSTHEHADFMMYINGKQIDFTKPQYQVAHPFVHVEDPDVTPYVIHKHATGITYGMFFKTLDITIDDCVTINSKEFCDANGRSVKYYLNGVVTPSLASTEIHDLDKALISYGAETASEVQAQLASVGNRACTASGKCGDGNVSRE